jgi:hypothetical protein
MFNRPGNVPSPQDIGVWFDYQQSGSSALSVAEFLILRIKRRENISVNYLSECGAIVMISCNILIFPIFEADDGQVTFARIFTFGVSQCNDVTNEFSLLADGAYVDQEFEFKAVVFPLDVLHPLADLRFDCSVVARGHFKSILQRQPRCMSKVQAPGESFMNDNVLCCNSTFHSSAQDR